MEEIWKDIKGYEGKYQVSNKGRVKRLKFYRYDFNKKCSLPICKEIILKPIVNTHNYLQVDLYNNGVRTTKAIHRLVAETFIEIQKHKCEVNHINGDTKDNRVENLEWISHYENVLHARNVLNRGTMPKKVKCIETGIVYVSIYQAAKSVNGNAHHICECCNGKRKTTNKHHWEYVEV